MPKLCERNLCSGCHACYNACPTASIIMEQDAEGFLYPVIDSNTCINCQLCEMTCPILKHKATKEQTPKAFAAYSKDEKILENSSSGGVFYHIARKVIDDGGVVFGAAFDENFNVIHKAIDKLDDIIKLQGSKYVQSKIGDTYKQAKQFLESGRIVLFSGTPCQIEGLRAFLGRKYENLYTQDIICHGVPSPKVWQTYLSCRLRNISDIIDKVEFRNKEWGWEKYSLKLLFSNKTHYRRTAHDDPYMKGFISNLYLRPSCSYCNAKGISRFSDITLADFWGVKEACNDCYNSKGVSLLLVHSEKGNKLLNSVSNEINICESVVETAIKYNSSAVISSKPHRKRTDFLREVNDENFDSLIEKSLRQHLLLRITRRIKNAAIKIKRTILFAF